MLQTGARDLAGEGIRHKKNFAHEVLRARITTAESNDSIPE